MQCIVADNAEVARRVHAWYGDGDVHRMSVDSLRWTQLPSRRSVRHVIIVTVKETIENGLAISFRFLDSRVNKPRPI